MKRKLLNFLVLLKLITSQLYDPFAYILGSNLIANPTISTPALPTATRTQFYPGGIQSWNCSTRCQVLSVPKVCTFFSLSCSNNYTQALDVETGTFPLISQDVTVTNTSEYLVSLWWMAPPVSPVGKSLEIQIDGVNLANLTCTTNVYSNQINQYLVNLTAGIRQIALKGFGISDGHGIFITGVFLQELIAVSNTTTNSTTNDTMNSTLNQTMNTTLNSTTNFTMNSTTNFTMNTTMNSTTNTTMDTTNTSLSQTDTTSLDIFNQLMLNNFTVALNSLPGNRIFFYNVTSFMITLDRLQLYYYHRHNLTDSSNTLLANINTLVMDKGSLPQSLLQSCNASVCNSINRFYEELKGSFDQKKNYTDPFFLEKNSDGFSFFANNLDFFYYELPAAFLVYLILSLFFKALFNYRISKYIRKYSFYGILLFIIYEGNIELFAFYFFTECKNLFSYDFKHKITNVIMIYFFFLLIVFSVGGFVWLMVNLKKLVKYFLEDSKEVNMKAILIQALQRLIYPLVFGAAHALLIDDLLVQSIVLFTIELSYFAVKVWVLRSAIPLYKFKVAMLLSTSLLRLFFIATFYLYEQQGHPSIINLVHYDLVWLYLICWAVQFVHDFLIVISEIFQAIKGQISGKKRNPLKKRSQIAKKLSESQQKNKENIILQIARQKGQKPQQTIKKSQKQMVISKRISSEKSQSKLREKSQKQKIAKKKVDFKDSSSKHRRDDSVIIIKPIRPVIDQNFSRPSSLKSPQHSLKGKKPTESSHIKMTTFRRQNINDNQMVDVMDRINTKQSKKLFQAKK